VAEDKEELTDGRCSRHKKRAAERTKRTETLV
jgi:hypothetical protein